METFTVTDEAKEMKRIILRSQVLRYIGPSKILRKKLSSQANLLRMNSGYEWHKQNIGSFR